MHSIKSEMCVNCLNYMWETEIIPLDAETRVMSCSAEEAIVEVAECYVTTSAICN